MFADILCDILFAPVVSNYIIFHPNVLVWQLQRPVLEQQVYLLVVCWPSPSSWRQSDCPPMISPSSWLLTGLCEYETWLYLTCRASNSLTGALPLYHVIPKLRQFVKFLAVLSVFSDRTCTVLNVEGDAFGAGLLQFFVDRQAKREEGTELSGVMLEDPSVPAPESSPLIAKRGNKDSEDSAKGVLSESVM